ncbi:hypothetical protein BJS_08969 [Bradyrhizobium japonicum SEMIA 5079]|nr:hypothetical protein BJS_08969 [Bradyrhizobium japonicum SEMIA 5079]
MALSLLGVALLLFATRESTALLIKVDQRTFFECLPEGCWSRVTAETSLAELAKRTHTDEKLLREGNPHIRGDVVHAGDEIRISDSMRAAR